METPKTLNGFLRGLIWLLVAGIWLLFTKTGIPGVIVCTLCVAYNSKRKIDTYRRSLEEYSGGLERHRDQLKKLSAEKICKILVLEELSKRDSESSRLVAKATLIWRTVITVIFIALNFALMNLMYFSQNAIIVGSALVFIYVRLFLSVDTVGVLCTAVKRNADVPISRLVAEHTFNDVEIPTCKNRILAGVVAAVISLGAFFYLNSTDRFVTEDVSGGCCITAYLPGVFSSGKVEVPAEIDGEPVVAIGKKAFADRFGVKEVKLSDGIVKIDSAAFKECVRLKKIELPESLEILNGEAFRNCRNLESIEIPRGVTEIRGYTFEGCKDLESVTLHDGIIDIHAYSFMDCRSLRTIDLPSGITEIHTYTFDGCKSLESIIIPDGVTRIAAHAFSGCSALRQVDLPDSLWEIGSSAFRDCDSLRSITIPSDTNVSYRAFKGSPTVVKRK